MIPRLALAGVSALIVLPYSRLATLVIVAIAAWMVTVERRRA